MRAVSAFALFLASCTAQILVRHHLQLNREHPMVRGPDAALLHLRRYFDTLPEALLSGTFSCSEFADPRLAPLCKYIAVKAKGPGAGEDRWQGFKYDIDSALKGCLRDKVTFPCPMYAVVKECSAWVYSNEDKLLSALQVHLKKSAGGKDDMDYLEGIGTLVRDLRPLPTAMRAAVFVGLLVSVLMLAACIFRFLFRGDYTLAAHSNVEQ